MQEKNIAEGKQKACLPMGIILAIGAFLRVWRLTANNLWFDESIPFVMTDNSIKTMLLGNKLYSPIIYNVFVYYLQKFLSDEFFLRLSSAFSGILSVLIIYLVGKQLFSRKTALWGAFLLAISPLHIYYSQELRMYSFISLLTLLSMYSLLKAVDENKYTFWMGYLIATALNIYMHPMTVFIFVAEIIFFLIYLRSYRQLFKKWIEINIVILIVLIPWVVSILTGIVLVIHKDEWFFKQALAWIPKPKLVSMFYTFKNFVIGYNAPKHAYLPAAFLFFILFCRGIFKSSQSKKGIIICLCCLFIPVFSVYFISQFRSCYLDRYFIPSSLFCFLIIGRGLSGLNRKYAALCIIAIVVLEAIALKNYYSNYMPGPFKEHIAVYHKKNFLGPVQYIAGNIREGDVVFHTCVDTIPSFKYYFNSVYKGNLSIKNDLVFDLISDRLAPFEYSTEYHTYINPSETLDVESLERIWVVYSGWDFKLAQVRDSKEARIIQRMNQLYVMQSKREFPDFIVYLYIPYR